MSVVRNILIPNRATQSINLSPSSDSSGASTTAARRSASAPSSPHGSSHTGRTSVCRSLRSIAQGGTQSASPKFQDGSELTGADDARNDSSLYGLRVGSKIETRWEIKVEKTIYTADKRSCGSDRRIRIKVKKRLVRQEVWWPGVVVNCFPRRTFTFENGTRSQSKYNEIYAHGCRGEERTCEIKKRQGILIRYFGCLDETERDFIAVPFSPHGLCQQSK